MEKHYLLSNFSQDRPGIVEEIPEPAAGMGHQMPDGNCLGNILISNFEIREISAYSGIKIELSFLNQFHSQCTGEGFGN